MRATTTTKPKAGCFRPDFRPNSTYKPNYMLNDRQQPVASFLVRINADFDGRSAELGQLAAEDVSMGALPAYEIFLSWLFLQLLLIAIPAVAAFLVGRRGRLQLWHLAALVLLAALLLLPAVACVSLRSRPEAWLSVVQMHAIGQPEFHVMGMHVNGWPAMLVALSLGFGLGIVLLRSGQRNRIPPGRPVGPPVDV